MHGGFSQTEQIHAEGADAAGVRGADEGQDGLLPEDAALGLDPHRQFCRGPEDGRRAHEGQFSLE